MPMPFTQESEAIQEQGCAALRALTVNDNNKVKVAESHGISAIISAMDHHMTTAVVQEQGCAALRNLAVNADNKVRVAEAGGIAAILNAMRAHPAVATVQHQGCWALKDLSVNDNNKVKIGDAGGVAVLLAAMKQPKASALVQEQVTPPFQAGSVGFMSVFSSVQDRRQGRHSMPCRCRRLPSKYRRLCSNRRWLRPKQRP